jgi:hypothetical protein
METEDKVGKEKKRWKVDAAVLHRASGIPGTVAVLLSPFHFSLVWPQYCGVNT